MPKLDGIEATKHLRAMGHDPSSLYIIAVTASGYAEDIALCLAAGMQAHLAKPIRLADLATALAAMGAAGNQTRHSTTDQLDTAAQRPDSHAKS